MNPYARKAKSYARYRWDHAPRAIETIIDVARIGPTSIVADIGSGTGIAARHFLGNARRVWAVEPEPAMRAESERALSRYPAFRSVAGCAEATTLDDASVDLIVTGQALDWFDPDTARREFARILRSDGWLAVLWNRSTDPAINGAYSAVARPQNGYRAEIGRPAGRPSTTDLVAFYCDERELVRTSVPGVNVQTREQYIGALLSDSHAPDPGDPLYETFADAAGQAFDRLAKDGRVVVPYITEVRIGQLRRSA